jgi:predicted nucleic acid-binding protein
MSDVAFFDTNILLYMYDRRDAEKRRLALDVFREHFEAETLVISTQVVQEFYVTVTRKFSLPPGQAKELIAGLCDLRLIAIESPQLLRAADLAAKFRVSYWDALILAASETAGASLLLSEEFSHGRDYGGVRVVNPLLPA